MMQKKFVEYFTCTFVTVVSTECLVDFQVKELVTNDLFAKYDKLLLQTSLDTMVDVMYCPRPCCQYPVLMEKDSNMGSCPACHFVFCVLCKLGYHGLSPCKIKSGMVFYHSVKSRIWKGHTIFGPKRALFVAKLDSEGTLFCRATALCRTLNICSILILD